MEEFNKISILSKKSLEIHRTEYIIKNVCKWVKDLVQRYIFCIIYVSWIHFMTEKRAKNEHETLNAYKIRKSI